MTNLNRLRQAQSSAELVRFWRPYETSFLHGYVLDVGARFFLFLGVADDMRFDGFHVLRIADAKRIQSDPYTAFVEAALRTRAQQVRRRPRVDLSSLDKLLASAGRLFPLVTIYRERVDSEVCHIGRVVKVKHGKVSLLEIDPAAEWDAEATEYSLNEITRVDFGGGYEEALWLVGGPEPQADSRLQRTARPGRREPVR
jgi:hypothetical protein